MIKFRKEEIYKERKRVKSPSNILALLEIPRLCVEAGPFYRHYNELLNLPNVSPETPIFLIQGLCMYDFFLKPLAELLRLRGHKVYYEWGYKFNKGFTTDVGDKLYRAINKIYQENNGKKVIVIGTSLGGLYAKVLAHFYPEKIAGVITLSSPQLIPLGTKIYLLYKILSGTIFRFGSEFIAKIESNPPVPMLSIYSSTDGYLPSCSLIPPSDFKTTIINMPRYGHCGIIYSFKAWREVILWINKICSPVVL